MLSHGRDLQSTSVTCSSPLRQTWGGSQYMYTLDTGAITTCPAVAGCRAQLRMPRYYCSSTGCPTIRRNGVLYWNDYLYYCCANDEWYHAYYSQATSQTNTVCPRENGLGTNPAAPRFRTCPYATSTCWGSGGVCRRCTQPTHGHTPHTHRPHSHRPHSHQLHRHNPHTHRPHTHRPHTHTPHRHTPHRHTPHTHQPQQQHRHTPHTHTPRSSPPPPACDGNSDFSSTGSRTLDNVFGNLSRYTSCNDTVHLHTAMDALQAEATACRAVQYSCVSPSSWTGNAGSVFQRALYCSNTCLAIDNNRGSIDCFQSVCGSGPRPATGCDSTSQAVSNINAMREQVIAACNHNIWGIVPSTMRTVLCMRQRVCSSFLFSSDATNCIASTCQGSSPDAPPPALPAPAAPPPPPPMPPPYTGQVLTWVLVVAGTVSTFDRTAFVIQLATYLRSMTQPRLLVEPSDIDLTVAAASVRVTARIRTRTPAAAETILRILPAQAPSALSQTLNVEVVSLESLVADGAPPGTSPANAYLAQRAGNDENGPPIGIIIVAVVVVVGLCLGGVCAYRRCRSKSKLKAPTTTVTITSPTPAVEMENATADSKI